MKYFGFSIDELQFALRIDQMERIVGAVAVSHIPDSSPLILGLINYHEEILPVLDFRYRLGLPSKTITSGDFFIVVQTSLRKFCIVVDSFSGILDVEEKAVIQASDLDSGLGVAGVFRNADGLYMIYDLEKFIKGNEQIELELAMNNNEEEE